MGGLKAPLFTPVPRLAHAALSFPLPQEEASYGHRSPAVVCALASCPWRGWCLPNELPMELQPHHSHGPHSSSADLGLQQSSCCRHCHSTSCPKPPTVLSPRPLPVPSLPGKSSCQTFATPTQSANHLHSLHLLKTSQSSRHFLRPVGCVQAPSLFFFFVTFQYRVFSSQAQDTPVAILRPFPPLTKHPTSRDPEMGKGGITHSTFFKSLSGFHHLYHHDFSLVKFNFILLLFCFTLCYFFLFYFISFHFVLHVRA